MLEFRIDDAAVAGSIAGMFCMYLIMQIPTGFLADSWGPRKTVTYGMFVALWNPLLFFIGDCFYLCWFRAIGLGYPFLYVCILVSGILV